MTGCICKCGCGRERVPDCNNLCERCWRQWCEGSEKHSPIADNSYMGTYGITNPWTGWIMGQAPHLVAETPAMLLRPEAPPRCPECGADMHRRIGAWKCYHHEEPVIVPETLDLPCSPRVKAMKIGRE
jgi:hypothetical protein